MLKNYLRKLLRQRGFDVVRHYPVAKMLNRRGINLVFDVGANTEQCATSLREHGYRGRIISFEPFTETYSRIKDNAAKDELWTAVRGALGERNESKVLNVWPVDSKFNSFLKAKSGADAFINDATNFRTEVTDIKTLDSVIDDYDRADDRIFLKSDTQGTKSKS